MSSTTPTAPNLRAKLRSCRGTFSRRALRMALVQQARRVLCPLRVSAVRTAAMFFKISPQTTAPAQARCGCRVAQARTPQMRAAHLSSAANSTGKMAKRSCLTVLLHEWQTQLLVDTPACHVRSPLLNSSRGLLYNPSGYSIANKLMVRSLRKHGALMAHELREDIKLQLPRPLKLCALMS